MSVDKFKRIVKVLIAEHVYQNELLFFVHNTPIGLLSKKQYDKVHPKLVSELNLGFEEFFPSVLNDDKQSEINSITTNVKNYITKRRHWFKAFEIIQELVCLAYEA